MLWDYYAAEDILFRLRSLQGQYAVFFSTFTFSGYIMYSSIFNSPAVRQCFLKLQSVFSLLVCMHPALCTVGSDRGSHVFNTHVAGLPFQTRVIERDPVM